MKLRKIDLLFEFIKKVFNEITKGAGGERLFGNTIIFIVIILIVGMGTSEIGGCEEIIVKDKIIIKETKIEIIVDNLYNYSKKGVKMVYKVLKGIDEFRQGIGFDINTILLTGIIYIIMKSEMENDDD